MNFTYQILHLLYISQQVSIYTSNTNLDAMSIKSYANRILKFLELLTAIFNSKMICRYDRLTHKSGKSQV